jgi:hypothetical protein
MHNLSTTLENQINLYTWSTCLKILERHGFITDDDDNPDMIEFKALFDSKSTWYVIRGEIVYLFSEPRLRDFLRYDD